MLSMLELYVRSMSARMDDVLIIMMEIYTRITRKGLMDRTGDAAMRAAEINSDELKLGPSMHKDMTGPSQC